MMIIMVKQDKLQSVNFSFVGRRWSKKSQVMMLMLLCYAGKYDTSVQEIN